MRRAICTLFAAGLAAQLSGCEEEGWWARSTITLTIDPDSATEGDETLASQGELAISRNSREDLVIGLASDDETELTVPATVTVPAGGMLATFDLTVEDDTDFDVTQTVTVTPSAVGWTGESDTIDILDDEAVLTVTLPANATEGDGVVTDGGTVVIPGTLSSDLVVELSSDDESELTVPADVTISAGETSASFDLTIQDDAEVDGTQTPTVTASADEWLPGSESMDVLDNP